MIIVQDEEKEWEDTVEIEEKSADTGCCVEGGDI